MTSKCLKVELWFYTNNNKISISAVKGEYTFEQEKEKIYTEMDSFKTIFNLYTDLDFIEAEEMVKLEAFNHFFKLGNIEATKKLAGYIKIDKLIK